VCSDCEPSDYVVTVAQAVHWFDLDWELDRLLDYVRTASACRRYVRETGTDPSDVVRRELEVAWGDPVHEWEVAWPLFLKVGRIG
jgi:hypothetical protein